MDGDRVRRRIATGAGDVVITGISMSKRSRKTNGFSN
jgi:hypothetical protein